MKFQPQLSNPLSAIQRPFVPLKNPQSQTEERRASLMARCRLLWLVALATVVSLFYLFSVLSTNGADVDEIGLTGFYRQPTRLRTAPASFDSAALLQWKRQMLQGLDEASSAAGDPEKSSLAIMPPWAGNATTRAELGRATWRLLHTMAARFPLLPTRFEQVSMEMFVVLLSRLYPCGECAQHFQKLIRQRPPNFESRDSAVQWMCETHNIVNKRLGKKQFDCARAADAWQCGCADQLD